MFLPCSTSLKFMKKMNGKSHLKFILGYISGWLHLLDYLKYLIYFKNILIGF